MLSCFRDAGAITSATSNHTILEDVVTQDYLGGSDTKDMDGNICLSGWKTIDASYDICIDLHIWHLQWWAAMHMQ